MCQTLEEKKAGGDYRKQAKAISKLWLELFELRGVLQQTPVGLSFERSGSTSIPVTTIKRRRYDKPPHAASAAP